MKRYTKNNEIKYANRIVVNKDGFNIYNPTEEQILADGWVEYVPPTPQEPTEDEKLQMAKNRKIAEINAYDLSNEVNSYNLNGAQGWLNKTERNSVERQIEARRASGQDNAPIWHGGVMLQVPCDLGLQLLQQLEIYASDCYNTTAMHKTKVQSLATIQEVEEYDYKTGYPDKLDLKL